MTVMKRVLSWLLYWFLRWLERPIESFDPHGWTDPKTGKDWAQRQ